MKIKKRLLILLSIAGITGLAATAPLGFLSKQISTVSLSKVSSLEQESVTDLIPSQSISQNSNLSTVNGPLTFWGNKITALDWYGSKIWDIDMSEYNIGYNGQKGEQAVYTGKGVSWERAWFNWDYNRKTNTIWVLGFYGGKNNDQQLIAIDASTGNVTKTIGLGNTGAVYYVSALTSGNVVCFGNAAKSYDGTAFLYNPSQNKVIQLQGNSKNEVDSMIDEGKTGYRWVFNNLIPVANNVNLLEMYSFGTKSGTTGDQSASLASYDVYFLLVDDNLNFIGQGSWSQPKKVASGIPGYRNSTVAPQHDYFVLLSGKVATVIYNTVVIIDPSNTNNIISTSFPMSEAKWIQSWTMDANDNLYFKFKDDPKIYKIEKNTLSSTTSSSLNPITYLDLSGISQNNVNTYANNFVIYNVFDYTGQLMMINSQSDLYIRNPALPDDNTTTKYGLAIGVTQNINNQAQGDYKGLLNTSESFQKAADFDINSSALSSKIPSEINQNDVVTLNNSFFQANSKYPSFVISDIDDSAGTFKVQVNLYQVPWFATTLPSGSIPKTIEKSFSTTNKITNKVSWKSLSTSTDYDFLNMLPSNLKVADVQNLDPFQASFQSQTITDASGKLLYPKKTYSITNQNDQNGAVKISVKYEYIPMGVTYTSGASNVLTYNSENTYTVFKSTEQSAFYFMGQSSQAVDNQNINIDVKNVPQLKSLLEANTLPSSFSSLVNQNTNNAGFLQFINTSLSKGYPVSKINFSLEPNDTAGTLKITARISQDNSPDKQAHTYIVTYTNLNKQNSYTFSFKNNVTSFGKVPFNTLLPSSVTEGEVMAYLVQYTGFDSNDFSISLSPDDAKGNLNVSVKLNSDYAPVIGNSNHGFTNYSTFYTFNGFMTTDQYNKKFSVEFVDDSSAKLLDLKLKQAQEIYDTLVVKKQSLKIGNQTYTNLSDLIERLLVANMGNSIPKNWSNNNQIQTTMYVDNSLGIASFYVKIPQNLLDGASSDLNLIANYSGFVKGNVDQTGDNLSFVSNNMLKNYLIAQKIFTEQQLSNMSAKEFGDWVKNSDNVKKIITYHTGQYDTKLQSNQYTLTVVSNDIQKTVSVTIDFGTMTNPKSLSNYSIQYIL
ncbi:MAG: hypothetical protein K2I76_03245 [Malacoplasma sp.]|nr:hypothetical protein [Malacoplasma sp.]MDE6082297.1 hypothetical protein [Malacoplasma sp.]MDE6563012.1 hypothetical protein [Malacoplasma sp.]